MAHCALVSSFNGIVINSRSDLEGQSLVLGNQYDAPTSEQMMKIIKCLHVAITSFKLIDMRFKWRPQNAIAELLRRILQCTQKPYLVVISTMTSFTKNDFNIKLAYCFINALEQITAFASALVSLHAIIIISPHGHGIFHKQIHSWLKLNVKVISRNIELPIL